MTELVGLVLYGSHARGDYDESSDIDLLAVSKGGVPACVSVDGLTVSRYPLDYVLRRARSGDLFAFHVVSEGKVVYEREPVLARMQGAFRCRSDYSRDVAMASDVGWFLVHRSDAVIDPLRFNRRMAWCTYTMVVARAAVACRPVFSATGLAAFAGSDAVAHVIRNKRSSEVQVGVVNLFRGVLERFGTAEPERLETLEAERRRFAADRNPAGTGAIRAMLSQVGATATPPEHGQVAHDRSR